LRGVDFDRGGVADREQLSGMGLYPKRRTGVEARVILAEVTQKSALTDGRARAGARRIGAVGGGALTIDVAGGPAEETLSLPLEELSSAFTEGLAEFFA